MAIKAQKRQGGVLLLENILAENAAEEISVADKGLHVGILGDFDSGDVVHVVEPAGVAGDYVVTNFNGNQDVGFNFLFGLKPQDLGSTTAVLGYKINFLNACWVTDLSRTLGSWATETLTNGCGETLTMSSSFETGEITFEFQQNWEIELQMAIKQRFQEAAPSVAVFYEPLGIDENGDAVRLGLAELSRCIVTGIDLSDPLDGVATGTLSGKFAGKVQTVRIA